MSTYYAFPPFPIDQICTTLCVHSLYSYWRDEKSVVRSLQELSQGTVGGMKHGFLSSAVGEFEKPQLKSAAYLNPGFHGSQTQLASLAVTKFSGGAGMNKSLLKR